MPFHESLIGSIIAAPGAFIQSVGKAFVQRQTLARFLWPAMRTIGWIGEAIEGRLGPPLGPVRRVLAATRLISLGFGPGAGSFIRGVAYPNVTEVAEGWLGFFPEFLITGTTQHRLVFGLQEAIGRGDFEAALDVIGDTAAEAGLEEILAVMRGVAQLGKDAETVLGIEGGATYLTAVFGELIVKVSDGELTDFGDILDELHGKGKKPGESQDEFDERFKDELADVLERISGGIGRARGVLGAGQEIVAALKRGTATFEKVLRTVSRALG